MGLVWHCLEPVPCAREDLSAQASTILLVACFPTLVVTPGSTSPLHTEAHDSLGSLHLGSLDLGMVLTP